MRLTGKIKMRLTGYLIIYFVSFMSMFKSGTSHEREYHYVQPQLLTRENGGNTDVTNHPNKNHLNDASSLDSASSQSKVNDDHSTVWSKGVQLHRRSVTLHLADSKRVLPELDLGTTSRKRELTLVDINNINRLDVQSQSHNGHSHADMVVRHSTDKSKENILTQFITKQTKNGYLRVSKMSKNKHRFKKGLRLLFNQYHGNKHVRSESPLSNEEPILPKEIPITKMYVKIDNTRPGNILIYGRDSMQEKLRPEALSDSLETSISTSLIENRFDKDSTQSSNLGVSASDHQQIHANSRPERLLASGGLFSDQFTVSERDDLSSFPYGPQWKEGFNYFHNVQRSEAPSASIRDQVTLIGSKKLSWDSFQAQQKLYQNEIKKRDKILGVNDPKISHMAIPVKNKRLDRTIKRDSLLLYNMLFHMNDNNPLHERVYKLHNPSSIRMTTLDRFWLATINKQDGPLKAIDNIYEYVYYLPSETKVVLHKIVFYKKKRTNETFKSMNYPRTLFRRRRNSARSESKKRYIKSKQTISNVQNLRLNGIKKVKWRKKYLTLEAIERFIPRSETFDAIKKEIDFEKLEDRVNTSENVSLLNSKTKQKETKIRRDVVHGSASLKSWTKSGLKFTTSSRRSRSEKSPEMSVFRHNARLSREKRATIKELSFAFVYGPEINLFANKGEQGLREGTGELNIENIEKKNQHELISNDLVDRIKYKHRYKKLRKNSLQKNFMLPLAYSDEVDIDLRKQGAVMADKIAIRQDGHLGILNDDEIDHTEKVLWEAYVEKDNERSGDNHRWSYSDESRVDGNSLTHDVSANNRGDDELEKLSVSSTSKSQYVNFNDSSHDDKLVHAEHDREEWSKNNMIYSSPQLMNNEIHSSPQLMNNVIHASPHLMNNEIHSSPHLMNNEIHSSPQLINSEIHSSPQLINSEMHSSPQLINSEIHSSPQLLNSEIHVSHTLTNEETYLKTSVTSKRDPYKVISVISKPYSQPSRQTLIDEPSAGESSVLCISMKDKELCPVLSPLSVPFIRDLDIGYLEGFSSYEELFHNDDFNKKNSLSQPTSSSKDVQLEKENMQAPFENKIFVQHDYSTRKRFDNKIESILFKSSLSTSDPMKVSHRIRRSASLTSESPWLTVQPTSPTETTDIVSTRTTMQTYVSMTTTGKFHHKKIFLFRKNEPSLDLTSIQYLKDYPVSKSNSWEKRDFDEEGKPIIKIGVILMAKSSALFSLNKSRSAIELAGEKVIAPNGPLPGYTIQLVFRDSACSDTFGPLAGIDLYMHKLANVYIGPSCDYALAPLARFTPYWGKGIPIITAGGLVGAFADKESFRLLTRMQASHTKTSQFVLSIFSALGWSTIGTVYYDVSISTRRPRSDCSFIITEIVTTLEQEFKHKPWFHNFDEKRMMNDTLDIAMQEIQKNARIVVLCASPNTVREIMIKAHELNFDNGEYVFFNIDLFSSKNASETPWFRADDTEERNNNARKAYESLMTVTLRTPTSAEYKHFSNEVKARASEMFPNFTYGEDEVNSFVGAFHDAVLLYALALNETLAENGSITDGHAITKRMWNRTFAGITGDVSIDANGDRNADYSLLDLNPETNKFEVVANYFGNKRVYEPVPNKTIHWAGGRLTPPPDTPTCGFDGSKCPPEEPFPEYGIVIIVLGSILLIVLVAVFFIYRHIKLEAELAEMNWRVRWDDILFGAPEKNKKLERQGSRLSLRKGSLPSDCSGDTIAVHLNDAGNRQLFTRTGYYKGAIIAIKPIPRSNITINKPMLLEIKRMKDLQNDHIVRFIGACIDFPNSCILTEYCPKGSLQDVLENEQIKLDWMFRYSIMQDIVRGMAYLQGTEIKSHGYLKSTNCVVDSRFVVKITDFGLHHLRGVIRNSEEDEHSYSYFHNKLWTAPELLRMAYRPPEGTIKGDVYSFAIICQEIVYRNGVFYMQNLDLSPQEIYQKVKMGAKPYFRPTLEEYDCPCDELAGVIRRCWAEDPADRPDFQALKSIIRKLNRDGDKGNILDNLLSRMEQYANNLEALVEERTADYLQQKKKAEDLLYNMLPKKVASQLIRGESVTAEWYDSVSIYFSDICGFTAMSAESTPMEVVDLLNDLYTTFDSIIENFDVYKVETIGDAYMVVSGLPDRNGILHAREIARMSLSLLKATLTFRIRHRPKDRLKIRIGIHTGSVCAGVVGLKMPRYCLFGDTVNTASRMESNGLPLKIHVSPQCKEVLDTFGTFELELRGNVEMKGKGSVKTYWLQGEKNTSDSPGVSLNIL